MREGSVPLGHAARRPQRAQHAAAALRVDGPRRDHRLPMRRRRRAAVPRLPFWRRHLGQQRLRERLAAPRGGGRWRGKHGDDGWAVRAAGACVGGALEVVQLKEDQAGGRDRIDLHRRRGLGRWILEPYK